MRALGCSLLNAPSRTYVLIMRFSRPSSRSFVAPLSTRSVSTSRLAATLWSFVVLRMRKLQRVPKGAASQVDVIYGKPAPEAASRHEAALTVLFASGREECHVSLDDDAWSEATTDVSDNCSSVDGDAVETVEEEWLKQSARSSLERRVAGGLRKRVKWVCVGHGRYVKKQEE